MNKTRKRILITLLVIVGLPIVLLIILFAVGVYLYKTADFLQPDVEVDLNDYELIVATDSVRVSQYGSVCLNEYGLWEARLQGNAVDRGAAYGVMSSDLLKYQEDVFVGQIFEIVKSDSWVDFLHKLIIIFNRNMAEHIPLEYREEIYAMTLSSSDKYNSYGSKYVRHLNYHAAHDIGHAMQQYMLVGCSSFATWGSESENGQLLIGRNFDFYVGDKFADNKVILFVEPTQGYKFASITWPGMIGVLSGMNEKGLTVTINAAKGDIPTSSAMPISLLARNILQNASTISEAYEIAKNCETFVSESLLIGSAADGYAAIIEKTPKKIALYRSDNNRVVCTNHYQSDAFSTDENNVENIENSDSPYRHQRINELIDNMAPLDPNEAVSILRNRYGLGNKDIGITNEKSINQFIAHHSVVFQPEELRLWVSTSPWQMGEYICYDLDEIFANSDFQRSYVLDSLNIAADSVAIENECKQAVEYREQYVAFQDAIENSTVVSQTMIDQFISNNPNYFQVYNTLGDYYLSRGNISEAKAYWRKALTMEIPRVDERKQIEKKLR